MTNVMKKQKMSDIAFLKGYKEQQTVENRFRFLKNLYFVGRVFLETRGRETRGRFSCFHHYFHLANDKYFFISKTGRNLEPVVEYQ
jgi:hypothetical protein